MTDPLPALIHLQFLRVDPRFLALQSNEKVVARQDFLRALEGAREGCSLAAYSLSALRSDCDILLARTAPELDALQLSADRLRAAGLGRYLLTAHSYFGTNPRRLSGAPGEGRGRYLLAQYWPGSRPAQAGGAPAWTGTAVSVSACRVLGEGAGGELWLFEGDDWRALEGLATAGAGGESQTFLAALKDMHELVEAL